MTILTISDNSINEANVISYDDDDEIRSIPLPAIDQSHSSTSAGSTFPHSVSDTVVK